MLATAASAAEAAARAAFAACRAVTLLAAGDWSSLLPAALLSVVILTPATDLAGLRGSGRVHCSRQVRTLYRGPEGRAGKSGRLPYECKAA